MVIDQENLLRDVERELLHAEAFSNAHGITADNVRDFLFAQPVLRRFKNSNFPDQTEFLDLWIVLDECQASDSQGYLVLFYPEKKMYGLGIKDVPDPVFLGCYGSLIETIAAM